MRLADLTSAEVADRLRRPGLYLKTGPFLFRIHADVPELVHSMQCLYGDFSLCEPVAIPDHQIGIYPSPTLRHRLLGRVVAVANGAASSIQYHRRSVAAAIEWEMNRCLWSHSHEYLIIHAATLERDGRAILLSAPPGSGKSTLCAALSQTGWRLLSDELAIIQPEDGHVLGTARPICLKNDSIQVIKQFCPAVRFGPLCPNTPKGVVGHLRPTQDSVRRSHEPATPAWIVFPRYQSEAKTCLQPKPRAASCLQLVRNCFNYNVLGERGFESLSRLVDTCECFEFEYSNLRAAIDCLQHLVEAPSPLGQDVPI